MYSSSPQEDVNLRALVDSNWQRFSKAEKDLSALLPEMVATGDAGRCIEIKNC